MFHLCSVVALPSPAPNTEDFLLSPKLLGIKPMSLLVCLWSLHPWRILRLSLLLCHYINGPYMFRTIFHVPFVKLQRLITYPRAYAPCVMTCCIFHAPSVLGCSHLQSAVLIFLSGGYDGPASCLSMVLSYWLFLQELGSLSVMIRSHI